jgi:hypothetical protein
VCHPAFLLRKEQRTFLSAGHCATLMQPSMPQRPQEEPPTRIGRELPGHPAGEEVPQERVQAALSALVRSATNSSPLGKQAQRFGCGFGVYRGQSLVARGGQRGGQGIDLVVLAGVASEARESTRTLAESLGGTSTTDSPEPASLPARCRPRPPAFSSA